MRFDTIKLSELAEIQTGPFGSQLHKEDYVVNGTPIVTVEHLGNRKFTEQNLPCVSDKDKERLKKYKLKTGDIVFSRVGSVDRCSYVSAEYEGWMFSGRCLRVRPCEILNSEYLYYFFSLKETKQFVRNIATGATMPSINTKFMGEVPIRVPSMEAQNKIASILWMIDDKIESMGSGTTFKEVSGNTMKNIVVSVPKDKQVQKKIASVLDAIDEKIEENERINNNLVA